MKRALVAILAAALVGVGLWWLSRPDPVAVRLHVVSRGLVEASLSNTRAGEIEACQRTRLSTIIGGRIEYLGVREGDRVEAGQLLMRLWNEDLAARIAVGGAQVDGARRRRDEICGLAATSAREAQRQRQLSARGFVSESRTEQADTDATQRAAACRTAEAELRTVEATLAATRTETERTILVAPFAGTVARITGELGEYSTPSPPGVATPPAIDLIDDSCLYVKAPMDEIDAPRIHPGQDARIMIDALAGKIFPAKVTRVAPYITVVERQARTVAVDVAFADPEDFRGLLVGYSADVEILLDRRDQVLRVPSGAIIDGNRVLVFNPQDGRIEARTIVPGIASWEHTEVVSGLSEGERIVVSLEREGTVAGALARPDQDAPARP